jgi:hypothetical protein
LIFQNNEAGTYGGALALIRDIRLLDLSTQSLLRITASKKGGGAIYAENESLSSKLVWNANHFSNNMATQGLGGQLFLLKVKEILDLRPGF